MASQNVGMAWRPRRLGVGSFDFTIEFAGQSPLKFDIFELQSDEHRKIGLVTSFWLRVSVRFATKISNMQVGKQEKSKCVFWFFIKKLLLNKLWIFRISNV